MTAKHWLSRARWLTGQIKDKERQKQSVYDTLTNTTQKYDVDGTQSTKDPHKYDRLAEYDDIIDQKKKEYIEAMLEITKAIDMLHDDRQRRVLTLYYTVTDQTTEKPLTFEQVAVELHYSYKQTRRIHAKGLCAIEKMLNGKDVLESPISYVI